MERVSLGTDGERAVRFMPAIETRFTPGAYLRDQHFFVVGSILFTCFLTAVLVVLCAPVGGIVVIDIFTIGAAIYYLLHDYHRQADYWRQSAEVLDAPESGAYYADLVEAPHFLTGRLAHEYVRAIQRADNAEITALKSSIRSSSEYTELWVHEAKTPLSAAKLITKRMTGEDAFALRRELERMDDLISQTLFAARAETLAADYLIREVSLLDVAKDSCKAHMHYLTSLGVTLDFQIGADLLVFADKIWLEFIITQIVINAAKYDATTITFRASELDTGTASECTVLEIKDDGCGIPAEDVPRVFERGFTGAVGRAHGSATGMGLYLAARMCASMGLSILLASEEGTGTRVQISFPHDRRRGRLETMHLYNLTDL